MTGGISPVAIPNVSHTTPTAAPVTAPTAIPTATPHSIRCALLGTPIAHSRSPRLQTALAHAVGIDLTYDCFETDVPALPGRIAMLRDAGYTGFNCTMPLKTAFAGLADLRTDAVARLTSANTGRFLPDGTLAAETTDGDGIRLALAHHGIALAGAHAVLLGAGGAARSVADGLRQGGVSALRIFNRTPRTVDGITSEPLDPAALTAAAADCDVLVNATALGMDGFPPFDTLAFLDALPAHACVADAVYKPRKTAFLAAAEARGLRAVDGLWMLLYQGVRSFTFWTGITPDGAAIEAAYRAIADD